jgi:T-complex protein 1 subunit gamma
MQQNQPPVYVLNTSTKRETGRRAQVSNIAAAKAVADVIRTCLGPRAMLKMMLDPVGGLALTNDGHAILREIDVAHPAAQSMIELARAQDESVGDGTTSVVVLAGELLQEAGPLLSVQGLHPSHIIASYTRSLALALEHVEKHAAFSVDPEDDEILFSMAAASLSTKFTARWSNLMCRLAVSASRVTTDRKRYVKIEKVPGGDLLTESRVIPGVMLNKDVVHAKMRRSIEKPRILLLDCPLEFRKNESQTNLELENEEDWAVVLQREEDYVKALCDGIAALKPDIVVTEKGVSDLAQHYLVKHNITAFRRLRKSDNNRLAAVTGAKICHRVEEATEEDMGTKCGLMEVRKLGDEYFAFFEKCEEKDLNACTILLRGASKDMLNEVERNLHDAMAVVRNVMDDPRLVPGGGAVEMSLSLLLEQQEPALARALTVIPRTLAENCGASAIRCVTALRAKHAEAPLDNIMFGIDGVTGKVRDMRKAGIVEPYAVKMQTLKTAFESAVLLLRVDDIVSSKAEQ